MEMCPKTHLNLTNACVIGKAAYRKMIWTFCSSEQAAKLVGLFPPLHSDNIFGMSLVVSKL